MAQYNGKFEKCGHDGVVSALGPHKKREWIIKYKFSGYCPECEKIHRQELKNTEYEMALKEAQELHLPQLEGTEKQVRWALVLRSEILKKIDRINYTEFIPEEKSDVEMIKNRLQGLDKFFSEETSCAENIENIVYMFFLGNTKASWWIENRNSFDFQASMRCILSILRTASREGINVIDDNIVDDIDDAEIDEITQEATVYPDDITTKAIATITFNDSMVKMTSPKDDVIRDVIKGMGFRWDRELRLWFMSIGTVNAPAAERAAELGNKLLNAGVPIRIYETDVREKAINGDFEPEYPRWLILKGSGKYAGYIGIVAKDTDATIRDKIRILPQAKEYGHVFFVAPRFYEDIEDFAELFAFKTSDKAKAALDRERSIYEKSRRIAPKVADEIKVDKDGLTDILKSSKEVLDDLRDN